MQPIKTSVCLWNQQLYAALAVALMVVSFAAVAQSAQSARKLAPLSLPLSLSAQSVHSTAPATISINQSTPQVLVFSANERTSGQDIGTTQNRLTKSCDGGNAPVCYDYRRNQIVVPGTKMWMPDLPGMKRESLTVKRDKVAFNYSF